MTSCSKTSEYPIKRGFRPLVEKGVGKLEPTPYLFAKFGRKEVIAMEKRKEYAEGEIIDCPRCGGDDIDCEEAPDKGKCLTCGLEFTIRQVAIWEE